MSWSPSVSAVLHEIKHSSGIIYVKSTLACTQGYNIEWAWGLESSINIHALFYFSSFPKHQNIARVYNTPSTEAGTWYPIPQHPGSAANPFISLELQP